MALSLTTLTIKGLFATLSMNDIQHNNTATMLIVFKLNVVILSVIMMNIVAPYYPIRGRDRLSIEIVICIFWYWPEVFLASTWISERRLVPIEILKDDVNVYASSYGARCQCYRSFHGSNVQIWLECLFLTSHFSLVECV